MGNSQPKLLHNNGPHFPPNLSCSQPRDDSGLYDFDQKVGSEVFSLKQEGYVLRHGETVKYSPDRDIQRFGVNAIHLAQVVQTPEGVFVKNMGTDGSAENELWLILRKSGEKKQCVVSVGDQYKLGRIRLRVNELSTVAQQKVHQVEYGRMQKFASVRNYQTAPCCRVCLSSEGETPLITPCNCDGSVAYIHVHCLREWFKNKVQATHVDGNTKVFYYAWKQLECEICKKQYQYNFEVDGLKFQLFDMVKPQGPYIMFESLTKDRNQLKGLYMVDMSDKAVVRMGRGQDIDMRLLDISVSRVHTLLVFQAGKFTISDAGSKFGTFCLVKERINLLNESASNHLQFHVAQTLLNFEVKCKKENLLKCFGVKQPPSRSLNPETERINASSPMYSMNDESLNDSLRQPPQRRLVPLPPPPQPPKLPEEDKRPEEEQFHKRQHDNMSSVQFDVNGLPPQNESIVSTTEQPNPSKRVSVSPLLVRQTSQGVSPQKARLHARSKSEIILEAEDYCEQYLKANDINQII